MTTNDYKTIVDITDNIPQMVWKIRVHDHDIKLLFTNKRWKEYIGDDTTLPFDTSIMHEDDYLEFTTLWRSTLLHKQDMITKRRLKKYDGTFTWVETRCVKNDTDDDVWYGTCTDITHYVEDATKARQYAVDLAERMKAEDKTSTLLKEYAQDLLEKEQDAERVRLALQEHTERLAEKAVKAEEIRQKLLLFAKDLADKAIAAEKSRVDLVEVALEKETARLALFEHAKGLAQTAEKAEDARMDLVKYAETLAQDVVKAEDTRITLSEHAETLAHDAAKAEDTRITLSEHAQNLAQDAAKAEIDRIKLTERTKELLRMTIADQQLKIIINSVPIIIWVVDTNGIFTLSEGNGLVNLGQTTSSLLKTSIYNLFPKTEHQWIRKTLETGEKSSRNVRMMHNRIYNIEYSPLMFSAEIIGAIILAQDITVQMDLETQKNALLLREQLAKNEIVMKSQFLANMSHELRTPIYGMMGNLEYLLESNLTPEQKECAEMSFQSVTFITKVVNDMLDTFMLDAGRLTLESVQFDLVNVINNSVRILRNQALVKGIDLDLDIDKHVPQFVVGDPVRIQQIINNIVGNAIKFTTEGVVSIDVISDTNENNSNENTVMIKMKVQDTGIGISEDHVKNIFQNFSQIDSSNTRPFGGIGMGLNISDKLVKLMNGSITVDSKVGVGSVFSIKMMLKRIPKIVIPKVLESVSLDSVRVLVAEDNIINQKIVKNQLTKVGARVTIVNNGFDAVETYKVSNFDVILMDCHMPVMDGYDSTKALRSKGCRIPIIALTANALQENLDKCLKIGMDDYITKPAKALHLITKVKEWADKKKSKHSNCL